jgi:hypothetical protein
MVRNKSAPESIDSGHILGYIPLSKSSSFLLYNRLKLQKLHILEKNRGKCFFQEYEVFVPSSACTEKMKMI